MLDVGNLMQGCYVRLVMFKEVINFLWLFIFDGNHFNLLFLFYYFWRLLRKYIANYSLTSWANHILESETNQIRIEPSC